MPVQGSYLLWLTAASIILLLLLILAAKLHAFLALILTSMALGIAAGMPPQSVLRSIQNGFGEALGFIAVVVGLGAVIGRFVEHSGGGRELAGWLLSKFGRERAAWAVVTASFLVGLPIFFEVGFIILVPLIWSLTEESRKSLLYYGMPMSAALTVTHALVPPHPAPAAAAQLLGADIGRTILYGAALAVPMILAGGMGYGSWIAARLFIPLPAMATRDNGVDPKGLPPPRPLTVALILLLPVVLILLSTAVAGHVVPGQRILAFLGHPFAALLAATFAAMFFFGLRRGLDRGRILRMATESLAPIGTLLLIMGGGGAFKQVIVDSGVGPYLGHLLVVSRISPLLVAYLVAAAMRIAQGSATVAIITAAGIVAPLVKGIAGYEPEMIVLALSCGGTILSHVNDAGFWLVKEYFGMTVPQTLRSWTVMKVVTSMVGFGLVLAAQELFF
jgi:gluconate transporter